MDFDFTEEQRLFRAEVRTCFGSREIRDQQQKVAHLEPDPRTVYRLMAQNGLLAVNWPSIYGGRGGSNLDAAILSEEMSRHHIPDALYVNSILIVGSLLLHGASEGQKADYLPRMAKGDIYGCVLYTEPEAGSDLGALSTRAVPTADGRFRLYGRKVYSMKTHLVDFAICAARSSESTKHDGISLFIIPLHTDTVRLKRLDSMADEAFYAIELDGVEVGPESVIGGLGGGWTVITKALALERTGHDYYVKGLRWFDALKQQVAAEGLAEDRWVRAHLAELQGRLEVARFLTYKVLKQIDSGVVDEATAAMSKWFASELAGEVTSRALTLLGTRACLKYMGETFTYSSLETAYREAPGTTISAGTSEMMLETLAGLKLAQDVS